MSKDNVFSLDRFRTKGLLDAAKPSKVAPRKRPRTDETFARIPYHRVTQLYGQLSAAALHVMIELDHQHFKARGKNPLRLGNQTDLAAAGMQRSTKLKALRQLRDAGLITYHEEGHRAHVVTLLWHEVVL